MWHIYFIKTPHHNLKRSEWGGGGGRCSNAGWMGQLLQKHNEFYLNALVNYTHFGSSLHSCEKEHPTLDTIDLAV